MLNVGYVNTRVSIAIRLIPLNETIFSCEVHFASEHVPNILNFKSEQSNVFVFITSWNSKYTYIKLIVNTTKLYWRPNLKSQICIRHVHLHEIQVAYRPECKRPASNVVEEQVWTTFGSIELSSSNINFSQIHSHTQAKHSEWMLCTSNNPFEAFPIAERLQVQIHETKHSGRDNKIRDMEWNCVKHLKKRCSLATKWNLILFLPFLSWYRIIHEMSLSEEKNVYHKAFCSRKLLHLEHTKQENYDYPFTDILFRHFYRAVCILLLHFNDNGSWVCW